MTEMMCQSVPYQPPTSSLFVSMVSFSWFVKGLRNEDFKKRWDSIINLCFPFFFCTQKTKCFWFPCYGTSKYTSTFQNTLRCLDRSHCNDTVLSIWQRAYIWKEMCKHKLLLYWYHITVKYSSASWI